MKSAFGKLGGLLTDVGAIALPSGVEGERCKGAGAGPRMKKAGDGGGRQWLVNQQKAISD